MSCDTIPPCAHLTIMEYLQVLECVLLNDHHNILDQYGDMTMHISNWQMNCYFRLIWTLREDDINTSWAKWDILITDDTEVISSTDKATQ